MGFNPCQCHYDNTTHKYTYDIHTNTHIAQNKTTKSKQTNQISSQSYTNCEGHITANEYSVEERKEIKRSLIEALETY
jgi:hypothetical protein